jgi:outer membrane protein assembly factor BamB
MFLSAYGLLYRNAYTAIYAFNWTNGKIAWKYTCPAVATYETPYVNENGTTVYSTNIGGAIADGKYYSYNTEHSATVPITRGWQLHCINATTGEGIWKVALPGGGSKHTTDVGPIADGYLSVGGSDGFMYVFGKGKSVTTVTAPDAVMPKGNGVVIKGTVLDQSPAQPGTPCVSKQSMALQMEHLHKQLPINGIWRNETIKGVPVKLTAMDSNGNAIDIGTVTSNGYYGTFGIEWTPPKTGTYEIIASFAGDESYGSSAASTTLSVGLSPSGSQTPQPTAVPVEMTPLFYGLAVGVIVIVIAIAIATLLILRKH